MNICRELVFVPICFSIVYYSTQPLNKTRNNYVSIWRNIALNTVSLKENLKKNMNGKVIKIEESL